MSPLFSSNKLFFLSVQTTGLTNDAIDGIISILGARPHKILPGKLIFHLPTSTDTETITAVFEQPTAPSVILSVRDVCPHCRKPVTPLSNECGDYGEGTCDASATAAV
jgi:hypothetical protein